jgi:uncharacterized RDD family membrane protein YckC
VAVLNSFTAPAPVEPSPPAPFPGAGGDRLVSGEAVELEVRVARLGSRALALLLDIIVQALLVDLLIFLAGIGLLLMGSYVDEALVFAVMIGIVVTVLIGYPTLQETLFRGRTLGKMAIGLRVVRVDGGPIRFRHAFTRALISVTLEWPGLILAPLTWAVSLGTMLAQPQGRRIGDLAAGTLVIHDRTPAAWGWVPAMPPPLMAWAPLLDLTGLSDDLALAVRHFLARNRDIKEPARSRLGHALAAEVAACTTPPPPPGVPGWAYLAAVLAERHRRAALRIASARQLSATVWTAVGPPPPAPRPQRRRWLKR